MSFIGIFLYYKSFFMTKYCLLWIFSQIPTSTYIIKKAPDESEGEIDSGCYHMYEDPTTLSTNQILIPH